MVLKSHQEDRGKNGVYDQRNKLNNLTGKQWLFSTRSVITKTHPQFYNENSMISKRYYNYLPVHLIKEIILTFSKPNALIVDPFCNVGSSGFATLLASDHRAYLGWNKKSHEGLIQNDDFITKIQDNPDLIQFNKRILNLETITMGFQRVDFIFTELIYTSPDSIERQTEFNHWLSDLKNIFTILSDLLSEKQYIAVAVQNIKLPSYYFYCSKKIVDMFSEIGWTLKGELIWQITSFRKLTNVTKVRSSTNSLKDHDRHFTYLNINDKRILIFRLI